MGGGGGLINTIAYTENLQTYVIELFLLNFEKKKCTPSKFNSINKTCKYISSNNNPLSLHVADVLSTF